MRALSATSTRVDAYEAGREIGEALAELGPELVVVFSSIHYDFADQHEGIIDGLGREDVLIFGGTGDGFFETSSSSDVGVAAPPWRKIRWPLETGASASVGVTIRITGEGTTVRG